MEALEVLCGAINPVLREASADGTNFASVSSSARYVTAWRKDLEHYHAPFSQDIQLRWFESCEAIRKYEPQNSVQDLLREGPVASTRTSQEVSPGWSATKSVTTRGTKPCLNDKGHLGWDSIHSQPIQHNRRDRLPAGLAHLPLGSGIFLLQFLQEEDLDNYSFHPQQ